MSSVDTTLWIEAFVDELARAGVREVVIAPGSRSTPLVFAFAADERFRVRVHLDERSAAFFALGVGKVSGVPGVVVTTSGTAAANVFPAVIEASQGEVPLLVLTADRPHRLRDSDANQAIDQLRLYGPFVRAFHEVAPPAVTVEGLAHLRALAGRAVAAARGAPPGPVHVNLPLDKPLEPESGHADFRQRHPVAAEGRPDGAPFVCIDRGRREASPEAVERLLRALSSPRGVIVAGPVPDPDRVGPALRRLASATGFPLLADALSGGRFGASQEAHVVGAYDLFLRDEVARAALAPSVVLRVGASPTSAALLGWLQQQPEAMHLVLGESGRWKDHGAIAAQYVDADAADTLEVLAELAVARAEDAWRDLWRRVEAGAIRGMSGAATGGNEAEVAGSILEVLPEESSLFVSSSMPVRDVDGYGLPRDERIRVWGNRGASGIDGIVSTAFGVSAASEAPTVCLLGDIAFFHDQNGLLWAREPDAPVVFVLIDNDGGGIFHMLPVADHEPEFTRYFATPHGLDFAHAGALFGIPFADVDLPNVGEELKAALVAGGTRILRVRTERVGSRVARADVVQAVSRSVRGVLS